MLATRVARVGREMTALWLAATAVTPRLDPPARRQLARRQAGRTLRALGARIRAFGTPPAADEPLLVVANHVSWLDVYAVGAHLDVRFVAKAETRSWPVAGTIMRGFDAIFIVRGSFRDAHRVKNAVASALRAGERVVAFPEATTTGGHHVRPFFGALFQAAIDARARVLPVAIRYPTPLGHPNPSAAFVDDMTFGASLLRVLRERDLRLELHWGPTLATEGTSRRVLAAMAHAWISDALATPRWVEAPRPRLRDRLSSGLAAGPFRFPPAAGTQPA